MVGTMTWLGLDVHARWTGRRDPAAMGRSCLWLNRTGSWFGRRVGQVDEVRDQPFVAGTPRNETISRPPSATLGALASGHL